MQFDYSNVTLLSIKNNKEIVTAHKNDTSTGVRNSTYGQEDELYSLHLDEWSSITDQGDSQWSSVADQGDSQYALYSVITMTVVIIIVGCTGK